MKAEREGIRTQIQTVSANAFILSTYDAARYSIPIKNLVRYIDDARFAIDNGAAERAIRPLAIGRSNWLHVGGDGGLKTASVLLSVCASAIRRRLNPWSYLRDVLEQLAARPATADVNDLLPETWTNANHPVAEHSSPFDSSRTHSNLIVHRTGTKKQQEPPPRDGSMYCSYACATHSSLLFRGLDFEF